MILLKVTIYDTLKAAYLEKLASFVSFPVQDFFTVVDKRNSENFPASRFRVVSVSDYKKERSDPSASQDA